MLADVDRERALAHRRPAGHDDEIAGLQAGGHLVEIGVAGGDARHVRRIVAVVERLDAVDDLGQQVLQHGERALPARALLRDVQHLRFGLVEHGLGAPSHGVVGGIGDLAGGGRELAQDRAFAHDLRVMADVGGGRHVLHERAQVREAADVVELLHRLQRLRQRHHVDRLALAAQLRDVPVDDAVRIAVEIVLADDVADAVRGLVVEQQAAQDRLLRLQRMRRQLQGIDLGIVGHRDSGFRVGSAGRGKWTRGLVLTCSLQNGFYADWAIGGSRLAVTARDARLAGLSRRARSPQTGGSLRGTVRKGRSTHDLPFRTARSGPAAAPRARRPGPSHAATGCVMRCKGNNGACVVTQVCIGLRKTALRKFLVHARFRRRPDPHPRDQASSGLAAHHADARQWPMRAGRPSAARRVMGGGAVGGRGWTLTAPPGPIATRLRP